MNAVAEKRAPTPPSPSDHTEAGRSSMATAVDPSPKSVKDKEAGIRTEVHPGETEGDYDVYGDENADIQYRSMHWWKAAMLMLAETVSLGILSIPSVFAAVGMAAGCILVIGLGALATATGYVIGSFKMRYPHVHNMADAGYILWGPIGRELLGGAQVLFMVFICGSHVLTGLIAFDTITAGVSCSVVWAALSAIICFIFTIPRTLNHISYFSVVSFISIIAAIFITMIAVGIKGPQGGVTSHVSLGFAPAFLAVTNIIFAYAGHVAFFTFIAEMKKPRDFPKTLFALQIADTSLYLIVGIVVYAFAGPNTISPALGNTGTLVRKIAYGIALPTIMIAGVINGHVCAKLVFVRLFRTKDGKPSNHMSSHTLKGWATWIGLCAIIWTLAFIIAEVIPFFNDLLGVISALFASWFTYGLSGIFWFHLTPRKRYFAGPLAIVRTTFWAFIVFVGGFIMVAGMYASIKSIIEGYRSGEFGTPFTCRSQS